LDDATRIVSLMATAGPGRGGVGQEAGAVLQRLRALIG